MSNRINIKNKILLNLFKHFKDSEKKLHELRYLFWECTLRCNLNCLHCGSDCSKNVIQKDMPLEDFLRTIYSLKNHIKPDTAIVVITGGEPLLRKDIEICGRELRKSGFRWGIVTNGYLYNEERHETLMSSGLGALTISIDGLEENHNWLRNSAQSFEKAIYALNIIRKEKRLNYDIVTCVNQRNLNDLEKLKNYFIDKEIKAWRLFTISPIGRAANNNELHLEPVHFKYLMNFIHESRLEKNIDIKFSCEGFVGHYENKVRDGFFFCRAGINIGSILVDGSISACPNINDSFIQGNIYNEDFYNVWNNKFKSLRKRNWTKTGQCINCKVYKWCEGNGLHFWDSEKKNVLRCHYHLLNNCN